MRVTAINADADLEQQIARELQLAEDAVRDGNPDKARGHYTVMAGLISRRSDEQVEAMERAMGLRS